MSCSTSPHRRAPRRPLQPAAASPPSHRLHSSASPPRATTPATTSSAAVIVFTSSAAAPPLPLGPLSSANPTSPAMSIFEYNGSTLVAMVGKNCFTIASERRLGVQLQTISTDFKRIYKIHDKLYIGLSGLATDDQTLYQRLVFCHKLYQLREERDMKPETFASLISSMLYEEIWSILLSTSNCWTRR